MQDELIGIQRAPYATGPMRLLTHVFDFLLGRGIQKEATTPGFLGFVHGSIGVCHQFVGKRGVFR